MQVLILATAVGGRPKPELCFLPGRLRLTLLPKEGYGNSLIGCGSNTQPSTWEADIYHWANAAPNAGVFCLLMDGVSHFSSGLSKYSRNLL